MKNADTLLQAWATGLDLVVIDRRNGKVTVHAIRKISFLANLQVHVWWGEEGTGGSVFTLKAGWACGSGFTLEDRKQFYSTYILEAAEALFLKSRDVLPKSQAPTPQFKEQPEGVMPSDEDAISKFVEHKPATAPEFMYEVPKSAKGLTTLAPIFNPFHRENP